jgi:gliding motility-associated-like protein
MCSLPKTITVTNLSNPIGGTVFNWNFVESYPGYSVTPISSSSVNPTFTVTDIDTNRYSVTQMDFQDSITVIMTTARGCTARANILYVDTIYLPTARFMTDKWQGCVPLTVNFYDSSHSREPIVLYEYHFDDGSSPLTGVASPVHTYTNTGVYYPWLVIHNSNGCLDTSYRVKIEVGRPPSASFSVTPTNICIGDTVHFTNTTPASDSVDTWHFYGDGGYYASSCFTDPNPDWPFTHATGAQTISMVACFRGCCDSVTQTGAVTVKGPLAHFSAAMDCDSSHVYTFTGNISDATNWDWNFGDGNTAMASSASVISHSYTATGNYWVYLTAHNPGTGCSDSKDSMYIHVRDIKADFIFDTVMCTNIPHTFDASTSVDVYTFPHNGYTWIWDDNTHPDMTSNSSITHSFPTGIHTVKLVVRDVNNCPDTVTKRIKAYSVSAAFTPSQPSICSVDTITFINNSVADTTIASYSWNFGDGSPLSSLTSPTHTFNITNTVVTTNTVTLTVTTALGCVSTVSVVLNISRPNANFNSISSVNICSGDSVHLNHPVSYPTMNWTFGDGGTKSGVTAPWHPYTTAGTYTVNLFVQDALGCTDTRSSVVVSVQNKPQVYISSPAFWSSSLCYPYQAVFTDSSIANVFWKRNWNLGTGPVVGSATVGKNYTSPGTYTVSLAEWTTNGCVDSTKRTFTLYGPVADFDLAPPLICKGASITFNIKDTSDVFTWHWDFGDGQDTVALSPISHPYNVHPPGGTTNVTLVYWSKDSTCPQTKIYPVSIHQVISDFKRNNEISMADTAHCLGVRDTFINISTAATTYGWSFGDGATSTLFSPGHQYTAPGTYSVELNIRDNVTGCVDTLIKKMYIFPPANGMAVGDSVCKGQSGQLSASGGTTYTWSPAANLSCANCQNPSSSATASLTYTVIVGDVNGCRDTVTTPYYVQQPPPTQTWSTSIVVGQTATLPGDAGVGYTYTWTPVTDLSCTNCASPVSSSTVDIVYTETLADVMGCFTAQSTFTVEVKPLSSVDVPTAFTPNGDGVNDVVYVAGWGIKKLNYFKIFNRWGELVFETDDITVGWDGTYKGVPQNTETYVYEVSVLPYIDNKPLTKKGAVKLLR